MLVTDGAGGLMANGIPFLVDPRRRNSVRCAATCAARQHAVARLPRRLPALVIFQGPEHYVTPSWYATKRETAKVVPTWNYAMVQARGTATAIEDAAWLHRQIRGLTDMMEARRAEPWAVDDAPADFLASQVKGIVGIEIVLNRHRRQMESQPEIAPKSDRAGVIEGLSEIGTGEAEATAALVAKGRS